MQTKGEIEAEISTALTNFEQEYMGRGPSSVNVHLIGEIVLIRLMGMMTQAEQNLARSLPPATGRDLVKQVRTQIIEMARPKLDAMIKKITGVKVVSLHHDISTTTGEKIIVFTLAEAPRFRVK